MQLRPSEDTLFSCTSNRWLCNEEQELKIRYTPLNVDALEKIACDSVGASRCLSWEKIGEGSFNKVFLLRFDSDSQVIIRVPCPVVGNVVQVTSSEVATMSYVSDKWAHTKSSLMPLPPRLVSWNATSDTMGFYLRESAEAAVNSILELEHALLRESFCQHVSLCFADDMPEELRNPALYPTGVPVEEDGVIQELSRKYCIGPTANREWWRGEYARIGANRGPWPDMETMIKSAAEFQLRALDVVDFSSSHVKSAPSNVPLLRRLLETCMRIAPHIVPRDPALTAPVLKHPDLSLSNLIVLLDGLARVDHVIDWQFTTVAPFVTLCGYASGLVYPETVILVPRDLSMPPWPDNFAELSAEEQDFVRMHHRFACRYRGYALLSSTKDGDPLRRKAWSLPQWTSLANLVPQITRCIAEGPLGLRECLIELQENWGSFADGPCLIDFSVDERAAHLAEAEAHAEYTRNVTPLIHELGLLDDLSVDPKDYETAMELMKKRRGEWDQAIMKGPFIRENPSYEGAPSYFLS